MPIFDNNGKKQNVQDAHVGKYMELYPDATTIMEREGKKYRVKAKDYNTFLGDTLEAPKKESAPMVTAPQQDVLQTQTEIAAPVRQPMPKSEYLGKITLETPNTPVEGDIYRGEYGTYTRTEVPYKTKEYASLEDAKAGRELNIEVSDEEALERMRKDGESRAAERYTQPMQGMKTGEQQEYSMQGALNRAKQDMLPYVIAEEITTPLMEEFATRRNGKHAAEYNEMDARNIQRGAFGYNPETGKVEIEKDAYMRADDIELIEEYAKQARKRMLADDGLKAKAQEQADMLGMGLEEYVDAVAIPTLQERMWNEWVSPQEEDARRSYDAMSAMWDNSIIGMLDSHVGLFRPKPETNTDRYLKMVGQEEWSKNASLLERAGGFAGAMALDLPFFGGLGKLASVPAQYAGKQALKQMVARETQQMVARGVSEAAAKRYANYVVKNGLKNRILLNLSTAPLQSGLTFGMFDAGKAAMNMSLNDEWSWKELGKSAAGGTLLGGALGVTGAVGSGLTHGLSGAAKVGAKVAEFGVENAVFTEGGRLIGKLHGEQPENGWLEDYVESGATLLMLKVPGIVKNMSRIKGNKEASEVFTFDKLEREQLGKYGKDLNAVLESMLPRNENVAVDGKGVSLDGINEGRLTEEYVRVMNDVEIPLTTKAKLMGIVEGKAMTPPRVVDAKAEGNRVLTYDPMGRLVEIKEYKNDADANKELEKLQPAMDRNLIGVLEDMYIRIKGYEADDVTVREWLAKNPDVKAEDVATIVAKDNAGEPLTKAEQKVLDSMRQARREGLNDASHLNKIVAALEDAGINAKDVMTGIDKPMTERTETEQRAVNAYRNILIREVGDMFKETAPAGDVNGSKNSGTDIVMRTNESDRSVDETANNGMVYTTTAPSGEKIIITGGKVVLDNEGYIDVNHSERLVAMFPDGQKKSVRPGDLREKVEVSNAEELKAAKREEIKQEIAAENGWKPIEVGAEYDVVFDGDAFRVKVEGRDENGDVIISSEGASMAVPESFLQDAMKQAENGKALQTENGEVKAADKREQSTSSLDVMPSESGLREAKTEIEAPVVEGEKGDNAEKVVESSPTGEAAAFEQNIPVDEKGKKMWEQSTPEYIAEYIRVRKPEDVEAQMSVVSGMIEGLEKQKSKMDAMDAMDIDDKIAFWKKVGELIGGAKDVVDPISQLNAKHSSALTAFNSMLENIRREGNEQKAAIRYEGLENMVAELGKQLPEGYTIGVVDGKYTIVEAQPAETAPVVENTPIAETPQATNEMQEADLENAEKGQKTVEPVGENKPKVRGRKQVEKAVEKMRKADAEGNALEVLNNIQTAELNAERGDEGAITPEEQAEIDALKKKYAEQGYEMQDMTGKVYDEGMRIEADFVIDESLPDGAAVIKSTIKPYIFKDGVMVQKAKVIVALSPVKAIEPVGKGYFGEIYDQFKNGFKAAFDFLVGKKRGEAVGVFNREGIGEIDLVWGDEKAGLSHILTKHVGEGKSFESLEDAKNGIADVIENGKVVFQDGDKVVIQKDGKIVTLRKNVREKGKKIADKNWILTAYDETKADDTSAISGTNEGQAAQPAVVSEGEGTTQSAKVQENTQKSDENAETGGEKMYSSEELAEAKEQLGELNATSAPAFAARLFSIKPWKTLEEANAALKELLASYGETLNGQSLAVMPFLDEAQRLISENSKNQEPRSVEEVLENGDKRITNYNSRGEVATVATERDGKVVSVDSYNDGVLFEHTEYDENGVSTSVTRYDKQGNVIGTQEFADGKAVPSGKVKAKQEKASQGERSNGKTESESKQEVEKIEDVGEVLAGARKDALKVLASSFENATVKSLIELPFSKAFKKPDLKKAVESGALREEDALFYEAMFNALINSSKPKNSTRHRNAVETWAEETYNSLQLIKSFVEADEAARDRAMADALEDKFPARAEELAVIEKRKVWNARNNAEWGDKTTPNPVWVAHEVLKALGYKPGDKVEIPFGVLKANVFATGYEFYNKKGERLIMQSVPTVEEGIENIVWLSKIKRGDADTMHPVSSFFATPTKRDMGDSGRYYVLWGTVRNPRRSEFGSIEEANAFAAGHKEAVVRPIQEVVKRYGYKLIFREPITGDKFFVNDMEFETEGEAMQYLEDHYDAVNEQTNELLAKERGEAKKEVSADDLLEVAMVRGKEGWKYAVNIKGKYANNMGMPLLLREFDTREDAKAFLNESKNEVFEIYKKQQAEQKKFVFFDTGENSRIGEDYRGGRDVTAKDFMDTFGFRGVQFGNWTNQEDRQMAVNQAFDAFMDLAKLLGVSPKALSLNGELGMAFGSRGSGFGNAHYEPGEIVINLTKTRGAGSLAHEWWHALDNYFARRANVPMGMVTDSRSIDMRPELRQAYNELLKMIEKSDFYKRSKAKGDYWGRMHEVTARLMAEWVDQSLKDRGELNTFLSRGVNEERYKRMNYDVHRAVALIKGKEALSYEEFEKTPEALAGFPYPSRAELKEFGDAMRNIFETVEEQETEEGKVVLYNIADEMQMLMNKDTEAFKRATKVTMEAVKRLKANGLDIEVVSQEEADAMMELAEMQKRTAPETVSVQDEHLQTVVSSAGKRKSPETALPEDESSFKGTAISSDDGAKILKDIDSAIAKYENSNDRAETFIGNVAKALGIDAKDKSSKYATFEAKNGVIFTIRISNHNATVSNFDNAGEGNGISIVISRKPNEGVTNDGNAHLVEFFYPEKKISKADGKPLVEILKSIKQALYSGEYKDNTGLAVREEVNIPEMMTVFHGSGAQFDRFDHSFMGTGEGNQVFGWGTYVAEVEGIGKQYAEAQAMPHLRTPQMAVYDDLSRYDGDFYSAKQNLLDYYNSVLEKYPDNYTIITRKNLLEDITETDYKKSHIFKSRNLYSVEIPDDNGSNYLHWDKPINRRVIDRIIKSLPKGIDVKFWVPNYLANASNSEKALWWMNEYYKRKPRSGEAFYNLLSATLGSDKAASEFLNNLGFVGISYPAEAMTGGRADGARNYVIFNENDAVIENRVEFLRTANGKVYGWAVDGKIRLAPDGINPNTPVHEYAHLWGADVEKNNPKLWNEVVEAMKLSPVWNEVANDANYSNIHGNDSRMASEVLARLSGRENYRRTMEEAEKEIAAERDIVGKVQKKGILNRIKNALKNFWNWVQRNVFRKKENATAKATTEVMPWEEFANSVVGDFYKGKNPNVKESPLEGMFVGEKVDREGNVIGDGSSHVEYKVDEVKSQPISRIDLSNGPVRGVNEPEWKFKARREKWRRWVESNTNMKTPMPEKPFLQEGESIEEYEARMKEFNKELNKWKKDILSNESEIEKMMDILYEGKMPEMNPTPEDEFTEQVFKRYMGDDGIKVDRKSMRGMIMDEIIERRRKIETNNFDDVVFIDKVRKATTAEQRKAIPFIIEGTYNGKVTPELAAVVNRIRDWFENVYQALQAADAMHSSGKIKNYVTHIWDKNRTPKAVYENYINTRSKYTNRRSIDTYAEGIALGMVPKYDDICDIMLEYGHIANEAIANKDFTDFLHMLRVDGEPVLKDATIRDPMYVRTSSEALDGYKVHKYAKGIVENVLGNVRTENAPEWMQKLAHFYDVSGSLMKKINLSLSFFHHGALLETAVGAMNPAKAVSTVFKNLVWDCMRSGELPALSNPEATRNAVNHLVQLGATQDYMAKEVNRLTGRLKEVLKDFSDKHPNWVTKGAVKPAELLDFLNTGFDKVLWDYLHDGLKIYTFDKYAKEIEEYAKKKGIGDTEKDMLLNEAGQLVNDIYGGQFWELIDVSPAAVKWLRRLLLSPDWTISTIRQALSPIGFGTLYKDYEKNWAQRTVGTGLSASFRRKQGVKFWITALLTFGALMNGLNAWRRKEDVDRELEKAEERRKTDPEYKSPYELKYPDGMKWYDYTMYGNTIGHQTHLFGWRYDDDKEGYIRWGKQFRELPELFLGKDGFSFPGPMIDKMVGKANPALSAGLAFLGYAKDGWQSKWMKDKKGWEKELGRVMMMASAFMPYSIPTDDDKEFVLTDLMMPSSKGFSNNKAIRGFETAILSQDFDYVGAVYDACVMNKIDAEKLLQAAIARVEAQAKAEYVEGANTLNEAWDKYQEDLEINEKRAVRTKFNKLLQENAYKDFAKQEARDMVQSVLDGTYREEKLPEAYIASETAEDVRDAYKMDAIRLRLKKVVDDIPEDAVAYKQYYNDNKAKIDLYDETVAAKREINLIMEDIKITPQFTEQYMQEIRDIRREIIEMANNLTGNNE